MQEKTDVKPEEIRKKKWCKLRRRGKWRFNMNAKLDVYGECVVAADIGVVLLKGL